MTATDAKSKVNLKVLKPVISTRQLVTSFKRLLVNEASPGHDCLSNMKPLHVVFSPVKCIPLFIIIWLLKAVFRRD